MEELSPDWWGIQVVGDQDELSWFLAVLGNILVVLVVQSLICARLFVTPWTAAYQASLSFTIS